MAMQMRWCNASCISQYSTTMASHGATKRRFQASTRTVSPAPVAAMVIGGDNTQDTKTNCFFFSGTFLRRFAYRTALYPWDQNWLDRKGALRTPNPYQMFFTSSLGYLGHVETLIFKGGVRNLYLIDMINNWGFRVGKVRVFTGKDHNFCF